MGRQRMEPRKLTKDLVIASDASRVSVGATAVASPAPARRWHLRGVCRATAFTRKRHSLWDGRMARSVAQDCANATLERLGLRCVDLNDGVLLRTERPAGAVKGADLRVV